MIDSSYDEDTSGIDHSNLIKEYHNKNAKP